LDLLYERRKIIIIIISPSFKIHSLLLSWLGVVTKPTNAYKEYS